MTSQPDADITLFQRPGTSESPSKVHTEIVHTNLQQPIELEASPHRSAEETQDHGKEQSNEPEDVYDAAEDSSQVRKLRGIKWFLICISLYVSALVYGLDTTIAADVQGSIIQTFGHVDQLAWIGVGFPLGSVAVVLCVGMLFTRFNMKWMYVLSFGLFEVGSALCGAAPNMDAIIIGRVIAGMGGAGLYLGCLNYFSALATPSERGFYISLIGFCWGGGAVLGPIVGGALSVSSATWRWAFYINLVIGAATAPVYIFFLPSLHMGKPQRMIEHAKNLDFVGFVLNASMWVTFAVATTMAGGQWPWNDGRTIAVWVVFGLCIGAFFTQQWLCLFTTPGNRSFPAHLLRDRTQVLLFIGTASNIAGNFCVLYFIPIYFQFVHGDSAIMAAVRLLPFVVINVSTNLLTGHFIPRIQYYMVLYLFSAILIILGGGLLVGYLQPSTSESVIYGLTVLLAVGTGLTVTAGYTVASIKCAKQDIGNAITIQNVAQIGGSVITLVVAGQIFQSQAVRNLETVLAGLGFSSADIHGAVAGAQSEVFSQLTGGVRDAAIRAITDAIQRTFWLIVAAGIVMVIAAVFMRVEKLFDDDKTAEPSESEAA